MLAVPLLLDLTVTTGDPCHPPAIAAVLQTAIARADQRDVAGATAAIAPVAACPDASPAAFTARVLRADLAVREGDWAAASTALAGVGLHADAPLALRAGLLRLRADQGTGDTAAFARDRAALVAANDAALARIGKRIETFRAGAATVTAYEAGVDQGPFHRAIEFIVVPDAPLAYPASVLLTDDRMTTQIAALTTKPGEAKREHVWFLDQYTCTQHATLAPAIVGDTPPGYDALRQRVVDVAARPEMSAPVAPDRSICSSAAWLLPGLGGRR